MNNLKTNFILSIYTFLIFGWFLGFVITNLLSPIIVRFFEVGLFLFFFIFILEVVKIPKKYLYFIIILIILVIMVLLKYFFDYHMFYSDMVYFKTIYVLFFSFLIALSSANYFVNLSEFEKDNFFKILVYYACLYTILFFSLLIFKYKWIPGSSLYFYEIGQYYQGMSRAIGLFFLIIILGRKYINLPLWFFLLFINLLIMISFNGGGAVFAVCIGLMFYALIYKISIYKVAILPILIFISFNILSESESFIYFSERMMGKIESDNELFTRSWLLSKGLEYWWTDKYNFIFGSGITSYSCYIDDCMTYWHPHNFFVLLLTWFGVFSMPIIFFILIFTTFTGFFIYSSGNKVHLFLFGLYLYYFLLALIGGDIEQNRHFIFLLIFTYIIVNTKKYTYT